MVGGAAVASNAIKKLSEPGVPRLLLDVGDWFQGTPEGNFTQGRSLAEYFNLLGYDALTVGNHEYDYGEENLKSLIGSINAPVLGANVLTAATNERVPYLKPWIIKDVGGVKVGMFALITTGMSTLVFPKNFPGRAAGDEIEWARKTVSELKAAGAEVVILLSHVGYADLDKTQFKDDKAIATAVPGIDLIVGGHSHTLLKEPWREPKNGTLVVQTGSSLNRLGKVVLEIDPKTHKILRSEDKVYDLWVDQYGEDPAVLKLVEKYRKEVGSALDVVIGSSTVMLRRERYEESSLGDWMCDCTRKYTKTQIAFQNSGGIRADLTAGPVTMRTVFSIMPFDNTLVTLTMTGAQLREALEHSVDGDRGILQVAGLTMRYEAAAPRGKKLREVLVGGKPLQDAESYSVTAADFVVGGGDGYASFQRGADPAYTPVLVRDMLEWCVRNYSPLAMPTDGRIQKL